MTSTSTSQSDILLHLILNELEASSLFNKSLDLTPIKVLIAKINPVILSQLSSQLSDEKSKLGQMISLIISNVQTILKNNEMTIADGPVFLKIIKELYAAVGDLSEISITSNQLVDVTTEIVIIVLSMCISDQTKLNNIIALVNEASSLVKFIMPSKTFLQKYLPCLFN